MFRNIKNGYRSASLRFQSALWSPPCSSSPSSCLCRKSRSALQSSSVLQVKFRLILIWASHQKQDRCRKVTVPAEAGFRSSLIPNLWVSPPARHFLRTSPRLRLGSTAGCWCRCLFSSSLRSWCCSWTSPSTPVSCSPSSQLSSLDLSKGQRIPFCVRALLSVWNTGAILI